MLRFDGFLAVGDSGKMIRLNSYDEMLSFPYLIVAPLTAERHHSALQVAPLTAESLGDPPPGVLLRRRARVSGGEYWGDAYAVDG